MYVYLTWKRACEQLHLTWILVSNCCQLGWVDRKPIDCTLKAKTTATNSLPSLLALKREHKIEVRGKKQKALNKNGKLSKQRAWKAFFTDWTCDWTNTHTKKPLNHQIASKKTCFRQGVCLCPVSWHCKGKQGGGEQEKLKINLKIHWSTFCVL